MEANATMCERGFLIGKQEDGKHWEIRTLSDIQVLDDRASAIVCTMNCMATQPKSSEFAREWIAAWNSHDLKAIMSHYNENVVLTSPVAARILDLPSGTVEGKAALRDYFKRGLELYPDLRFELLDSMHGLASIVIC